MADEELKSCEVCGATVYPEHIDTGKAAFWAGQLMCPACLTEKKSETSTDTALSDKEDEPLTLVDEGDMEKSGRRVIQAMGGAAAAAKSALDDSKLKRSLNATGQGATRVRVFHTKMNDAAVAFMGQTINEWIDSHPDIEVKFVESTVGVWEGKHPEPNLILSVWY